MLKPRYLVALTAALLATTGSVTGAEYFNRIASFPVALNNPDAEEGTENSAEIITATEDGMTLVYSNALLGGIGFVDITNPAAPKRPPVSWRSMAARPRLPSLAARRW